MKIKSTYKFKIQGMNQEDFFNKMLIKKINITNIHRISHNETDFYIEQKNIKKTKKILQQNNIKILQLEPQGILKLKSLMRLGILIGLFLSTLFCIFANFFILKIDIQGINFIDRNEILKYLKQEKIELFSLKSSINLDEIELKLFENFNYISMVSVAQKGMSLIINIKEKNLTDIQKLMTYNDIVSDFDGKITNIEVFNGQTNFKIGDLVKYGDVLVSSQIVDSEGNTKNVKPIANITADVWISERLNFSENKIVQEFTGNTQVIKRMSIWNIPFFVSRNNLIIFDKYEEEHFFNKLKNTILPITIETRILKEYVEKSIYKSFESVEENLKKECKQNALQKLKNNDIIKEESCSVVNNNGVYSICYIITVNRKI